MSERDALIPLYSGRYLRREQISDAGGGARAVSETLDQAAGVRFVRSWGAWSIKPNASYKSQLVAGRGESLGSGLFDRGQASAGLEAERRGVKFTSVRQTVSAAASRYYHYQAARSPLFGAELLSDDRALDTAAYDYTAAADYALGERHVLSASAGVSLVDYPRQRVFEGAALSGRLRRDWLGTATLGAARRLPQETGARIFGSAGLSAGYAVLSSNQNGLDAGQSTPGQVRANPDYYSYMEWSAGPLVNLGGREGWKISVSYNYARRAYRARLVQDAAGGYAPDKVRTDIQTLSCVASYPLFGRLAVQASGGWLKASSNNRFETYSLSNYDYPYLFLGLSFAL